MLTTMTVLDVTRMKDDRVCIAGCLPDGTSIRPILPRRSFTEDWLYGDGPMLCRPFANLEIDLLDKIPGSGPPHTEDHHIGDRYRFLGLLPEADRRGLLAATAAPSLAELFGAPLRSDGASLKRWIVPGEGQRSLGTILATRVDGISFGQSQFKENTRYYTLSFTDEAGASYAMTITDLALRALLDAENASGERPGDVSTGLRNWLNQREVWLRIGLARAWDQNGQTEPRCYLQLNGLHSFPDYLGGRCYGDFVPRPEARQAIMRHDEDLAFEDDIPF